MEQNKTRTYLLYAVGEILLVVIGILIALQVNNWNEAQKASANERILLKNLKTDFDTRLSELKDFASQREQVLGTIGSLTDYIYQPSERLSNKKMDSLLTILSNTLLFNEQFKVLDVLFNTGKIDNISNQELKSLLLLWPQHVEEMVEEQRLRYDLYKDIFIPLEFKYISVRRVMESYNTSDFYFPTDRLKRFQSDYEGLLTDPEFENYLALMEALHRVNRNDSNILISNAERIIQLLENEIGE